MIVSVEEGVQEVEIPTSAREMLHSMLEMALGAFSEDRDKYMNSVVDMINGVFTTAQKQYASEIESSENIVAEAVEELQKQNGVIDAAQARVAEQHAHVKALTAKLAAVAQEFRTRRSAAAEIQRECENAGAEIARDGKAQEVLEATIEECFRPLCTEGVPEGGADEANLKIKKLCEALVVAKFDDSMVQALPMALVKAISSRGAFDVMCIQQVEHEVCNRAAAFKARVDGAASATAAREKALGEAKALFERSKSQQLELAQQLSTAQEEETARNIKVLEVKDVAKAIRKRSREAENAGDSWSRTLNCFNSGPVKAFETLRERTKPPAPVVEPEPVADEPEEAAAEEAAPPAADEAMPEAVAAA